eukprot:jgi/Botrbrau1/18635/Bobra.0367s0071.1
MGRDFNISTVFDGYSAKDFFEIVFFSPTMTLAFHREVHGDANANVGPWVDEQRVVNYRMAPDIPATLRAIIGVDVIPMEETQTIQEQQEDKYKVLSQPRVDLPAGKMVSTSIVFSLGDGPATAGPACEVQIDVVVSASGPFGLVGTVEGVMVTKGKEAVEKYLRYCRQYLVQLRASPQGLPPVSSQADAFFDALDYLPPSPLASGEAAGFPAGIDLETANAILRYLQSAQARLDGATEELRQVRDLVKRAGVTKSAGARGWWAPSSSSLLLGFALGATTVVVAYSAYRRARPPPPWVSI